MSTPKSDRRRLTMIIGASALVIAGTFGAQAIANSTTVQHAVVAAENPSFYTKAGWRRGHRGDRFSEMSEAELRKKITRGVRHLSIEIDGTDAQEKAMIDLITAQAVKLQPVRKRWKASGEKLKDLMLATTIDRAAVEAVRAERLADADTISKGVMKTLADVAEVLTPEQRVQLNERVESFRGRRGFWRH